MTALQTSTVSAPLAYLLHLADNALVLGQRNAEWCSHGPIREEDIALANMSLDLIGQARMLYQHAALMSAPTLATACAALPPEGAELARGGPSLRSLAGSGATEDSLAYFRDADAFRNYSLLELPHAGSGAERDYAGTIVRNFLYSTLMLLVWDALQDSKDAQLAAIAAKSLKEVAYHFRHSRDWLLRLGDGTPHSQARTQAALNRFMPYSQEFWTPTAIESIAISDGIAADTQSLQGRWNELVQQALREAGLQRPALGAALPQGKNGQHSQHLAPLLAELQVLARAHPEAQW